MAVPMPSEAAISRACTHRKEVGALPGPSLHARGSRQMASANRGQISQVHTPTAVRNADQRRESTTAADYANRADIFYRGSKFSVAVVGRGATPPTLPAASVAAMTPARRPGRRSGTASRRPGRPRRGRTWQAPRRGGRWSARRWRRRLRRLLVVAGLSGMVVAAVLLAAREGVDLTVLRRLPVTAEAAASIGLVLLAAALLLPNRRP